MTTPVDDIFDSPAATQAYWSTTNLAEGLPGVQSPLSWTVWRPAIELGLRAGFAGVGALERDRVTDPVLAADRIAANFYGRAAARVEFLGEMGDRLPGTTGAAIAEQFLGRLPEDFVSKSTWRRLPFVAVKMPIAIATAPRGVLNVHADARQAWSAGVHRTDMGLRECADMFDHAASLFRLAFARHAVVNFANVQPTYDLVNRIAAAAGCPELAGKVLGGQGSHPELIVVNDCWELSRGQLTLDGFLNAHGYHGPNEGELECASWREDPTPVHGLVKQYSARPDRDSPSATRERLAGDTAAAKDEILRNLPKLARPVALGVFGASDRYMGLRGVGKAAFLLAFDLCRATARRSGELLTASGALDDPSDVFYLTHQELTAAVLDSSFSGRVAQRRERRAEYRELVLPSAWRGRPTASRRARDDSGGELVIHATGASPGVVVARVRVVENPEFAEVEPGEILVASVTDPAWAPIMFVSAALVVDIGGLLSHAAVVARELGIPCVMGTGDATSRLRTGDLCRVDGYAGTVERLACASGADDV
jgi:phosphohistidine swiveling domain-containing protein